MPNTLLLNSDPIPYLSLLNLFTVQIWWVWFIIIFSKGSEFSTCSEHFNWQANPLHKQGFTYLNFTNAWILLVEFHLLLLSISNFYSRFLSQLSLQFLVVLCSSSGHALHRWVRHVQFFSHHHHHLAAPEFLFFIFFEWREKLNTKSLLGVHWHTVVVLWKEGGGISFGLESILLMLLHFEPIYFCSW